MRPATLRGRAGTFLDVRVPFIFCASSLYMYPPHMPLPHLPPTSLHTSQAFVPTSPQLVPVQSCSMLAPPLPCMHCHAWVSGTAWTPPLPVAILVWFAHRHASGARLCLIYAKTLKLMRCLPLWRHGRNAYAAGISLRDKARMDWRMTRVLRVFLVPGLVPLAYAAYYRYHGDPPPHFRQRTRDILAAALSFIPLYTRWFAAPALVAGTAREPVVLAWYRHFILTSFHSISATPHGSRSTASYPTHPAHTHPTHTPHTCPHTTHTTPHPHTPPTHPHPHTHRRPT